MTQYYDKNLRCKLPANNGNNDIVLNRNFNEWADYIAGNLSNRVPTGGVKYKRGADKKLLELCRDHEKNYDRPKRGDATIMFTHPLYLHMSHAGEIDSDWIKSEADKYLHRFLEFLKLKRDRSQVNVVALDTIHHYAAATSLLLEEGLLDQVIFTQYDSGRVIKKKDLAKFKKDNIFFGGGYNKRCLTSSIYEMQNKISTGSIWAIEELSLNSPQDYSETLRAPHIYGVSPSHVIRLGDVVRKLGMSP